MEVNPKLSSEKAIYDYELVKLAQQGQQKAFAELMDRYRDILYFMLLKMVNNPTDAEDLTIEAFSKAFRNLDQYVPTFAFSTWLFRIATNNCIDFLRRKRSNSLNANTQDIADFKSVTIKSEQLDPEEHYINNQKVKYMRDIVAQLKPRYRTLVELRYFEELSYEEIAEQLSMPLGTVKAQLFRARDLMYNILKNHSQHY
jgi:RNA polymerase sigma-70 factor (ECF subfamily)